MDMKKPVKPSTTMAEQVARLSQRGMVFGAQDPRQWLSSVGYYRLSGYWYPYRRFENGARADTPRVLRTNKAWPRGSPFQSPN